MPLSCGSKLAKYFLIIFNILLSILAIVMIAAGIYVLVAVKAAVKSGEWYGVQFGVLQAAAGILIGVGCAILFICWLGCCGAMKENTGCLICYSIIVFVLVIIQLVAFIMAVVFYSKINGGLHDTMTNTLKYNYSTDPTAPATKSWDFIQKEFHCCGVDHPIDWYSSQWKKNVSILTKVPTSCCVMNSTEFPVNETLCQALAYLNNTSSIYSYHEGCLLKVENSSKPQLIWFISVVLAVIFLQILVGIVACCLKSSIKSSYEKV